MEQLVNAATPSYYAMLSFCFLGIGIICTSVLIFIISGAVACKETLIILILGVLLFIPGFHFGNIYEKYDKPITAIVKPVICESYPDAADFVGALILVLLQIMELNTRFNIKRLLKMKKNL